LPDSYLIDDTNSADAIIAEVEGREPPIRKTKTKWTTREERQVQGVEFAHGKVIREWPLVEDETLKYLMQSMPKQQIRAFGGETSPAHLVAATYQTCPTPRSDRPRPSSKPFGLD
jgi:hypothetical protein